MSKTATRLGIFALVAASFLAIPAESEAFFFNWWGGNSCCGTTSYYRPTVSFFRPVRANYATNCCPQTCCYTPQTCCYTPQVCNVPVTSYYRVSTCDPCTGRRVSYLRPTVSYVRQVNYASSGCCTPTATYYSSSVSSDCCTPTITSQPTLSSGATSGGTTSETPSTFKESSSSQDALKPIPRVEEDNGSSSLNAPAQQDRTATVPPRPTWTYRRAVATADEVQPRVLPAAQSAPAQPRRLSESGWRASR